MTQRNDKKVMKNDNTEGWQKLMTQRMAQSDDAMWWNTVMTIRDDSKYLHKVITHVDEKSDDTEIWQKWMTQSDNTMW